MKFDKLLKKVGIGDDDTPNFLKFQGKYTPHQKLLWCGSDDINGHRKSKKTHPKKFKYWKDRSITYKYNNLGFRSDFDFLPGMHGDIYLGCSFTEGIGLPLECAWPTLLSNYLKTPGFNLGIGGYSIDSCFRHLVAAYRYGLKFKRVFLLAPPANRYEHIINDNDLFKPYLSQRHQDNQIIHTMPSMMNHLWSDQVKLDGNNQFISSFLIGGRNNSLVNSLKTILAIQAFTVEAGARFFYLTYEEMSKAHHWNSAKKYRTHKSVPARDGHWASYYHKYLKAQFVSNYGGIDKTLI